mgnify:CR=1 FL=1|jgi:hypothetical protein
MNVYKFTIIALCVVNIKATAQQSINELLAAGVSDTQRFADSYIAPASEGLIYGISNGWFNNAKSPRRFGFEISLIGNVNFVDDNKRSFKMIESDYENIRFEDGSSSKNVATVFGNSENQKVVLTYADPVFGNQEIEVLLPGGIGSSESSIVPTAFLQVGFSPLKGTQVKARFIPKLNFNDASLSAFGVGIQQDLLSWLPTRKVLPVAASGVIAYTNLKSKYDFTATEIVEGNNQQMTLNANSMLYQLILGTKLKIINFYGALGYVSGTTKTKLLGTYKIVSGAVSSNEVIDPVSIEHKISGMRTTLGANLKLAFFGINADYTFADYNSISFGINFGF